jgi:hypothetical protein
MNFDFPEPYDLEVPRRIREARQQVSQEGEEVLERILAQEGSPEDVVRALEPLPTSDQRTLLDINNLLGEAYRATAEAHQGWANLHGQLARLIERAQALDPTFAALGDKATTGEAVAVLRRHGEPLGVSDEVLEMIVEVPED